ncbi:hypothetical protein CC86DRAFT_387296 [Ophiobolus disseminans]|uniref:Zn(2)-C6 fungal-type domain-containing protein n=1 Tax=Ophiobolus disseminans TaxID=1469910 RepID=A0A6A6ZHN7_9PLEO|nr:hypothetical protein CC86DRAFT_387296 [Ophiobolus disseminans]
MPPKRTWSQANNGSTSASPASRPRVSDVALDSNIPAISRKVKACASCRKQKIKCIMTDSGPPCKRCTERSLSCVLNKSLQTLIEERSQWKDTVIGDLGQIHSSLQQVLEKLSLPSLRPLQTSTPHLLEDDYQYESVDREDEMPSYDDSPRLSPKEAGLPHAPIDSLYQITRLRTLRSDDSPGERKLSVERNGTSHINDFISRGLVSIEDADRLVGLFVNRIDHFMYKIGAGSYRDLDSMRRGSSVLTACVCTVAALHDPNSNHLYATCGREFRRLMSASMFDPRMNQDCMRAMCVASYWLHDLSWMLSGYAIRRAMEVNLSSSYQQVLRNHDEEAMNNVRIWYVLYICDRHLSILYGRSSIVRDDVSVNGWEEILRSPICTESDKRLVSQMALLVIMGNARELFGPDTGEPIPIAFAPQFEKFSRQIDQWVGFWSSELLKLHESIGEFPTKGVILHHHLSKLHLHSHVFRGLKGAPVPHYFQSSAVAAVTAATSIIEIILTDDDIREGLVGIPHYIHSMIAFACVFLLKIAGQYSGQYIEDAVVFDLATKAVQQFRSTPVGKWHLVHLMAEGLEKMLAKKTMPSATQTELAAHSSTVSNTEYAAPVTNATTPLATGEGMFSDETNRPSFDDVFNFGTSSFLNFDTGTIDLDFTGFGF